MAEQMERKKHARKKTPAVAGVFLRACFLRSIRSAMAASEQEYSDSLRETVYLICKSGYRRRFNQGRPYKRTEERVLKATKRQDTRESMNKVIPQRTVTNHAAALIDDRDTIENIREALGVRNTYKLMHINQLYEPARTYLLQRVVI